VVILNPIILKTLKMYLDENSDIPKEMQSLVEKLLKIETLPGSSKEGIDKLYDQIFEQFIPNSDLVEWSKNYVQ
jgi:hypothetical protein